MGFFVVFLLATVKVLAVVFFAVVALSFAWLVLVGVSFLTTGGMSLSLDSDSSLSLSRSMLGTTSSVALPVASSGHRKKESQLIAIGSVSLAGKLWRGV